MSGRLGPIEAVTFDVGGTLWHTDWDPVAIWRAFLAERGIERAPEAIRHAFRAWPDEPVRIPSNPPEERTYFFENDRRVARALGLELTLEDFAGIEGAFRRMPGTSLFPDTLPALKRLRAKGVPLAVVSNASSDVVGRMGSLGVARYFDPIVYSFGHGIEKPDPRIFRIALRGLGRPADRVVHVGDSYTADVEGARGAGMKAVHLVREGDGVHGDHVTIRSLEELPGLLG